MGFFCSVLENHMDISGRFSYKILSRNLFILCVLLSGYSAKAQNNSYPFRPGERLNYSMHFGWFRIGEAEIWIDPKINAEEGTSCYLIRANFISTNWGLVFPKLDVCLESLVDINSLRPQVSLRNMQYGKSIDIRTDDFAYGDSVRVHTYIEDIDSHRYHAFSKSEVPIFDVLSTYLWMRSQDVDKLKESVTVGVFYTKSLYQFTLEYTEDVVYMLNDELVDALEFKMIFAENDIFTKGKYGQAIVTADERRLPLEFKIDMSLGSFYFKLEDFQVDK